jgi:hypothetical protein
VLTVAAGALLVAAALALGATEAEDDAEDVDDDAACGLELLLHAATASDTDTATAKEDQILERDNRDISQE